MYDDDKTTIVVSAGNRNTLISKMETVIKEFGA